MVGSVPFLSEAYQPTSTRASRCRRSTCSLNICVAFRVHGNLAPMDADPRKRDDRLFTIKDVAAVLPVSERTLRDVIASLGFRRPPGRKRYC